MIQKTIFINVIVLLFGYSLSFRNIVKHVSHLKNQENIPYRHDKNITFDLQPNSSRDKHHYSESDESDNHHHQEQYGEESDEDHKSQGKHNRAHEKHHYDSDDDGKDDNLYEVHDHKEGQGDETSHLDGKFREREGHKKGHKTKAYNNRFHRDEFYKQRKIYDDGHKDEKNRKFNDNRSQNEEKKRTLKKGVKRQFQEKDVHKGKREPPKILENNLKLQNNNQQNPAKVFFNGYYENKGGNQYEQLLRRLHKNKGYK